MGPPSHSELGEWPQLTTGQELEHFAGKQEKARWCLPPNKVYGFCPKKLIMVAGQLAEHGQPICTGRDWVILPAGMFPGRAPPLFNNPCLDLIFIQPWCWQGGFPAMATSLLCRAPPNWGEGLTQEGDNLTKQDGAGCH